MAGITIAIDAMGGDHGPIVTVPAALHALKTHDNLHLILTGDEAILNQFLNSYHATNEKRIKIRHASQQVTMDELPSQALRFKKDSSMRVAINLIKAGEAHACVSAGNTGALMATARFVLKTLPGVDRPAIIASFPTHNTQCEVRVLDLGANVDSCADHLYQFAAMGSIVTAAIDHIESPKVGLLNIGEEEIKGNDQVKQTAQLLSESAAINYLGYVEGNDIFLGTVDVVVCDGFVGNAVLKSSEGLAKLVASVAKQAFSRNVYTRLAAVVAAPVLKDLAKKLDPSRRNGASLLGLQGIVIKSHGSADKISYAYAIEEAVREVENNILERIRKEVGSMLEET